MPEVPTGRRDRDTNPHCRGIRGISACLDTGQKCHLFKDLGITLFCVCKAGDQTRALRVLGKCFLPLSYPPASGFILTH